MARLILHARYFAPNAKKRQGRLSYLIQYYGTREGAAKPLRRYFSHKTLYLWYNRHRQTRCVV